MRCTVVCKAERNSKKTQWFMGKQWLFKCSNSLHWRQWGAAAVTHDTNYTGLTEKVLSRCINEVWNTASCNFSTRQNELTLHTYVLKASFSHFCKTLTFSGAPPQSSDRKNKEIQRKLEMCCLFSSFFLKFSTLSLLKVNIFLTL